MKCLYGNDWNPTLKYGGMELGMFESNVSFSEQSKLSDFFDMRIIETFDGYSIPSYEVTLHMVKNGNMQTKNIDVSDFFKK